MKCPYCYGLDTRVLDSRQTEDGYVVRRRRICDKCGRRFTTYETAEIALVMVVKKDGRREAFDIAKVQNGLIRACEKRPVSMEAIEKMTAEIEKQVYSMGEKEINSDLIGDLVMDALREVDQVAYIRFASVYREFADVEKFAEEIDKLRKMAASERKERKTEVIQIAVDGPSGAGKSTIAKIVAKELGYDYIDTGAMYRAIGYKMKQENIQPDQLDLLENMLENTEVDLSGTQVLLDGVDVSKFIRTSEISDAASKAAQIPVVRKKLVELQRNMGSRKNVVMDGRDIGTNVFPQSKYKFFLTATPEERARRRFQELLEKGETITFEEVLKDVMERDHRDSNRKTDPLRKAEDAIEVDSTNLSIQETAEEILRYVRR